MKRYHVSTFLSEIYLKISKISHNIVLHRLRHWRRLGDLTLTLESRLEVWWMHETCGTLDSNSTGLRPLSNDTGTRRDSGDRTVCSE